MAFTFWDFSQRQGLPIWLSLFLVLGVVAPGDRLADPALRHPRARRGPGQRRAGRHRRPVRRAASGSRSRSGRPTPRTVPPFLPDERLPARRHLRHRPPAHHDRAVGRRRAAALPAAQPHPHRHRHARLGRQPRAAQAVRRQARAGRRRCRGRSASRSPALAGILLVPIVGLDYYALTLLVINAYAAAMLGRLKSLPLTFVGAMGLGLLQSFAVGLPPAPRARSPASRAVVPGAVPLRRHRRDAAGPAADRPGQGHRVRAAARR